MKSFSFFKQILIAIVLGMTVGQILGPKAAPLGEIGKIIIDLIKAAAAPLLFVTILHGCISHSIRKKEALRLFSISLFNVSCALIIAIGLSRFFKPGLHLNQLDLFSNRALPAGVAETKPIDFSASFLSFIPKSLFEPFLSNNILALVFLAIVLGLAIRATFKEHSKIIQGAEAVQKVLIRIIRWVVALVPLALFGVIAKSYGEYGLGPVKGLLGFVAVCIAGFLLQTLVVYHSWIRAYGKIPLREFWASAKPVILHAIGVNSSLATLPETLNALDRLRVSKQASTLGACVGTNLNNDGIVLYEAAAFFFVAQASGIDLTLSQQILGAVTCVIAAMGIAGVPEAGFISLAVVVATLKLPVETLPLLLSVDWILARCRSAVNCLSDMTLSIALDRRRVSGDSSGQATA